ncbi:MAG: hypothetical protein ACI9VR_000385 [Cognaticolwellia sp.]|jgi:hypothetical protein
MITLTLLLMSCEINQLGRPTLVDRARILGVASEPAEPAPGDQVTLSSLAVDPELGIGTVTWFGCVLEDSSGFGCALDSETLEELFAMDLEEMTPEEQIAWFEEVQAAGFIGVEPDLPPSFTVPTDLLDGLSEEEATEGKNYLFTLSALPGEGSLDNLDLDAQGDSLAETGLKRMPVSINPSPNQNPVIASLVLDGTYEVQDQDTLRVQAGQTYDFVMSLTEGSVEAYTFVNSAGEFEDRTEQPYVSMYASSGEFFQEISLSPYLESRWTAPVDSETSDHNLWLVLRDRRGGMTWMTLNLIVE